MNSLGWIVACLIFFALFYVGSFWRGLAYLGLFMVVTAMILANPIEPPAVALAVNNLLAVSVCGLPFWWAFKKWQRGRP